MLRELGLTWLETSLYEHEVSLLQRFLVDASLSGGEHLCTRMHGKSPHFVYLECHLPELSASEAHVCENG